MRVVVLVFGGMGGEGLGGVILRRIGLGFFDFRRFWEFKIVRMC